MQPLSWLRQQAALLRTLIATIAILAALTPAQATTYYVRPNGNDTTARNGQTNTDAGAWQTLAFACDQVPAGSHTIVLSAGTHIATRTAYPKSGVTIQGAGRTGSQVTLLQTAPSWNYPDPEYNEATFDQIIWDRPLDRFVIAMDNRDASGTENNVTVKNMKINDVSGTLDGAIVARAQWEVVITTGNHRFTNLEISNFRGCGIYFQDAVNIEIDNCYFYNTNNIYGVGMVRSRVSGNSKIHDNTFQSTGYDNAEGCKGTYGDGNKIYNNVFIGLGLWDVEYPHQDIRGLEIYNNVMSSGISVPKQASKYDPVSANEPYSVHVHNNVSTCPDFVEGPRPGLCIERNYIRSDPNRIGNIYRQHNSFGHGPVWIENNIIEGLPYCVVWSDGPMLDHVYVRNNTIYFRNQPDWTMFTGYIFDQVVENNILVADPNQPRRLVVADFDMNVALYRNNLLLNCTQAPVGNFVGAPQISRPYTPPAVQWKPGTRITDNPAADTTNRYAPTSATSNVVNRGVLTGLPFFGLAPDIGAKEYRTGQTENLSFNRVYNGDFEAQNGITTLPMGWISYENDPNNPKLAPSGKGYVDAYTLAPGKYSLTHWVPQEAGQPVKNYETYTYQTVRKLPPGNYMLKAWVRGEFNANHVFQVVVTVPDGTPNGTSTAINIRSSDVSSTEWRQVQLSAPVSISAHPSSNSSNVGYCNVGVYSFLSSEEWIQVDNIEFVKQ